MILTDGKQVQVYYGDNDIHIRGTHVFGEEFMYLGFMHSLPKPTNHDGICTIEESREHKKVIFEHSYAILAFSEQSQVDRLIEQLNHLKTNLPE